MYQNIYYDRKENIVHIWDDKVGYFATEYSPYAYRKSPNGRFKSLYGDNLEKITGEFDTRDPHLFESDVPVETRVLIDAYEDSDEPSIGHRLVIFDIEVSMEKQLPDVTKGNNEITAISLWNKIEDKYYAYILDKKNLLEDRVINNNYIYRFDSEIELLTAWLSKYEEIKPTILSGWNIDYFDIPYLYNRLKRVFDEETANRLSPIGVCGMKYRDEKMFIAGVSCIDYLLLYKKFTYTSEPTYRLDAIGRKEVKIGKVEYEGTLDTLLKNDINKFLEYSLNDVLIVKAIDDKLKFIELCISVCHVGHVPYENYPFSSRYLEGALLLYLRRKHIIAPNKPEFGREMYEELKESDDEGFSGAYVKDPVPGLYDWVYDLDLTSLYPSIIMSLNISPETKLGKYSATVWNSEKFVKGELDDIIIPIEKQANSTLYKALVNMNGKELKNFLETTKHSISSNGVVYEKSSMGLLGDVLDTWFKQRVEFRNLEKKYHKEGNKAQYEFYNKRQHIQKILLNSLFGVIGLPSFRFYDVDNAEAITLTGVTILKTMGNSINAYYRKTLGQKYSYKDGFVYANQKLKIDGKTFSQLSKSELQIVDEKEDFVIYQDTDSAFTLAYPMIKHMMPEIDLDDNVQMSEAILKVCEDVQNFVNKFFDVMALRLMNLTEHRFHAKQEVISRRGLWIAKKRYAQWIINKGGVSVDELEVKGLDVVRSSFPAKFRKFMETVLKDILDGKQKEYLDNEILTFKTEMKTFPVVEVAKNTSVKNISKWLGKKRKIFDSTVSGTPAHVKAAIAFNDFITHKGLDKKIEKIKDGEKIKWVYLKTNTFGIDGLAFRGFEDPAEVNEFIEANIDKDKIFEKELQNKLWDFYDALRWDKPSESAKKAATFFNF